MALATTDFSRGATVEEQGFLPASDPIVAKYGRYFAPGARLGRQRLLGVSCIVDVFGDAGTASLGFDAVVAALRTPAGRRSIAKELADEIAKSSGGRVKVRSVTFGRLIRFQAGQGAFRLTINIRTNYGRLQTVVDGIVVDRAIGLVALDGYPRQRITASTAMLGARKLAQHFQVAFKIRNVTPPAIVGTAQRGTTLTVNRGRWAGGPSSFTYQWNQCDAAGANCAAIAGAVGQTYVPGTTDAGMRLTVTVTGTNSVSSIPITSAATAPVT